MRVLITGMGGELGGQVASILAGDPDIEAIVGIDCEHPRRPVTGTEFHRLNPRGREATVEVVRSFEPTAIVHLGVYEPFARSSPKASIERTMNGSIALFGAAVQCSSVDRLVVRSGIEVYGRRRGSPQVPDEDVAPDPTTPFGHVLLHSERLARETGLAIAAPVTALRFAPVLGPRFPSPLGRCLRLPVVPVALADPSFSVLHQDDAAAAVVTALRRPIDGPVNIVAAGEIRISQAARRGGHLPAPVIGPGWRIAKAVSELFGAPIPEHVEELLRRGRTADGGRSLSELGFEPLLSTTEVIDELQGWGATRFDARQSSPGAGA